MDWSCTAGGDGHDGALWTGAVLQEAVAEAGCRDGSPPPPADNSGDTLFPALVPRVTSQPHMHEGKGAGHGSSRVLHYRFPGHAAATHSSTYHCNKYVL